MATAPDVRRTVPKPVHAPSSVSSRSVSPFSRRPSPPRSATPVPTTTGLSFSKSITDSLKKTNELLNQEVHKLRLQVEGLKNRCELQEVELQKSAMKNQKAMTVAADESGKCRAAKEVIKSLTAQLKDMAERLPPGAYDPESLKLIYIPPNGLAPNCVHFPGSYGETNSRSNTINASHVALNSGTDSERPSRMQGPSDREQGLNSISVLEPGNAGHVEAEWIEQYEPGVYITLVSLRDGSTDLKRVRFSRRKFGEHQAEA